MTTSASRRPPLDKDRLGAGGPGAPEGALVEVVEQAPSTNALVAARAAAGAAEGLVVVTEHQTSGRGRLDRVWETPPRAALTFSVLLRPRVPAAQWPWLPLLTGHAVATALRAGGVPAGVKWPNDVLVGERKLAGILVERVETPQGPAAVVGVGLNVTTTAAELPVDTATSLALLADGGGAPVPDRSDLLRALVAALLEAYAAWQAGGPAAADRLRTAYAGACVTLGRDVRVELPARGPLTGHAVGIDPEGRLQVRTPDGRTTAVGAGDVVHVRPASSPTRH